MGKRVGEGREGRRKKKRRRGDWWDMMGKGEWVEEFGLGLERIRVSNARK